MVEEGRFREDLYRRISQKKVHLLPLRERQEEIPHLVEVLLEKTGLRPTPQVIEALMLHSWPGNIRTLENELTDASLRAEGETVLSIGHLSEKPRQGVAPPTPREPSPPRDPPADDNKPTKQAQRAELRRLYATHRNARKAADLAGVKRATAHRWLKEDGLLDAADDEE